MLVRFPTKKWTGTPLTGTQPTKTCVGSSSKTRSYASTAGRLLSKRLRFEYTRFHQEWCAGERMMFQSREEPFENWKALIRGKGFPVLIAFNVSSSMVRLAPFRRRRTVRYR